MTTDYKKENKRSREEDEVDLTIFIKKIEAGYQNFVLSIRKGLKFIARNAMLLIISIVIGALVGYFLQSNSKPYYVSSMTLVLSDIRNEFVENQLNSLSEMIEEENYAGIANELDISTEAAAQIRSMNFVNLDQNRIDEDSILTGSPFNIELSLYDNRLFQSMEPALANFLENNRYFAKLKRIRQRKIESMIGKLKEQIASLDSIKSTSANPRGPVNGFVYGEALDPTNLYREGIAMYENQIELEAILERMDNIQVVNGFSPRNKPSGPKLILYLAAGAGISFLLGLILALNLEARATKL